MLRLRNASCSRTPWTRIATAYTHTHRRITTSSSVRHGAVRSGGAIDGTGDYMARCPPTIYSTTIGLRTDQNPYVAELASMAEAMRNMTP